MLHYLRRVFLISCGFLGVTYLLITLNIYNDPITPFRALFTAFTFGLLFPLLFAKTEEVYRNDQEHKLWLPLRNYTAARLSHKMWWRNIANFWLLFSSFLGGFYLLKLLHIYEASTPLVPLLTSFTLALLTSAIIRIYKLREVWWAPSYESE